MLGFRVRILHKAIVHSRSNSSLPNDERADIAATITLILLY